MAGKHTLGLTNVAMIAGLAAGSTVIAAEPQKNVAAGLYPTKELLVLMDQDRNGKVSWQEFMTFMEAEFDRLDTNKDGELDVQELTGVRVRRSNPTNHK